MNHLGIPCVVLPYFDFARTPITGWAWKTRTTLGSRGRTTPGPSSIVTVVAEPTRAGCMHASPEGESLVLLAMI